MTTRRLVGLAALLLLLPNLGCLMIDGGGTVMRASAEPAPVELSEAAPPARFAVRVHAGRDALFESSTASVSFGLRTACESPDEVLAGEVVIDHVAPDGSRRVESIALRCGDVAAGTTSSFELSECDDAACEGEVDVTLVPRGAAMSAAELLVEAQLIGNGPSESELFTVELIALD